MPFREILKSWSKILWNFQHISGQTDSPVEPLSGMDVRPTPRAWTLSKSRLDFDWVSEQGNCWPLGNFSDFLRWFLEKFWQAERELLNHGNTGRKWEGKLIKHIWKWMFSLKDHERHILKDLERFLFQGHQCLCFSGHRSAWKPSLADARRNINSSRCGPTY